MFRLIGFLVGVVLALVLLAAVVDRPTRDRVQALATKIAGTVLDVVDHVSPKAADPIAIDPPDRTPDQDMTAIVDRVSSVGEQPRSLPPPAAGEADAEFGRSEEDLPDLGGFNAPEVASGQGQEASAWQPIWTPFHSEISARGFAGRLGVLTGKEYRVTRTSPWSYQVEVAYADEAQRQALLLEIQERTGLALSGEKP